MLKKLKPLVMMQLKDKIDMLFLKSKKKTIMKIVLSVLGFVAVVAIVYVLLYLSKRLHFFSLLDMVPMSVMTLIFSIMFMMSIVSCTAGLVKSLYFAKDNLVLITLPVTSSQLFFSKLIVFYVYEIKRSFTFLVPLFVSYGLLNSFSILYYPWLCICFVFISLIPVVLGALLSIPVMAVTLVLKKFRALQLTLFSIVLVVLFFAILKIISLIPSNINIVGSWGTLFWQINDFLNSWQKSFAGLNYLVVMTGGSWAGLRHILFSGKTFVILGVTILIEVALIGLVYLCVKPLFFKMTSSPFEYRKKIVKSKIKNKKLPAVWSGVKTEFISNLREPSFLYNTFIVFAILPISILLLNKVYSAMNTRILGQQMAIVFNILIILLIILSANYRFASIYSREGGNIYITKTTPTGYIKVLLPKLVFNASVMILSLILTFVIYGNLTQMPTGQIVLMFVSILFVYIGHVLWSAELDFMNPQNKQYSTIGGAVNNPNETKSNIIAFIIAFVFAFVTFFLLREGASLAWIKMTVLSIVFVLCRVYLYATRVRLYYKEKEVV